MYWVNTANRDYVMVHVERDVKESCIPINAYTMENWLGFYVTEGAAIDAAATLKKPTWECQNCIPPSRRINRLEHR